MATIYDVDTTELIEKAAEELKKIDSMKAPAWTAFAKTGVNRERPPEKADWWYVRAAAILRSIYKLGTIGVSKLRTKYGGRKNRGHKPDAVRRGSGSVIRKALQQLEASGFLTKADKGIHKGRIITPKGKSFLDKIASSLYKVNSQKQKQDKEIEKEEQKKVEKVEELKQKAEPKAEIKSE